MSKFGELIDSETPILLDFYTDWNELSTSQKTPSVWEEMNYHIKKSI